MRFSGRVCSHFLLQIGRGGRGWPGCIYYIVCRNRAAGRFSAPRGETLLLFPPRHSKTFKRARGHWGPRGICSGCEIHSAREEGHDTNCIEYRTSARLLPLESLARGCSGSKFFCASGPTVQGRSSPSLDLDHALPSVYTPCLAEGRRFWKLLGRIIFFVAHLRLGFFLALRSAPAATSSLPRHRAKGEYSSFPRTWHCDHHFGCSEMCRFPTTL